jgi:hypothetical protein
MPGCTAQIVTGALDGRSTRCSVPPAKNAIDRPSGDQKSAVACSVPATGWLSSRASGRSQTRVACPSSAIQASWEPSGESASEFPSTDANWSVPFGCGI